MKRHFCMSTYLSSSETVSLFLTLIFGLMYRYLLFILLFNCRKINSNRQMKLWCRIQIRFGNSVYTTHFFHRWDDIYLTHDLPFHFSFQFSNSLLTSNISCRLALTVTIVKVFKLAVPSIGHVQLNSNLLPKRLILVLRRLVFFYCYF